jgi:dihydroorotate dehydrogenase
MLRAGADLVQVYTGFVYEGPLLPRMLSLGLLAALEREGVATLEDLVATLPPKATNGVHANGALPSALS